MNKGSLGMIIGGGLMIISLVFGILAACVDGMFIPFIIIFGVLLLVGLIILIVFGSMGNIKQRPAVGPRATGIVVGRNCCYKTKYVNAKLVKYYEYTLNVQTDMGTVTVYCNAVAYEGFNYQDPITIKYSFGEYRVAASSYKTNKKALFKGTGKTTLAIVIGIVGGLLVFGLVYLLVELIV